MERTQDLIRVQRQGQLEAWLSVDAVRAARTHAAREYIAALESRSILEALDWREAESAYQDALENARAPRLHSRR
jgi:hypothetical protein